jgi:TonB family protein
MPDGSVSSRSFVEYSDVHLFDSSAMQAVRTANRVPAKRAGKPVPCWVSVPIRFRLKERLGKNAVTKAQMLTLTEEELKKIGVEQQEEDILQILGWKKSHEDMLQMHVSINSHVTPKLMDDSVFNIYVDDLRKQGKFKLAAEWEETQWERGKRSLRGLLTDSITNMDNSGLATIVSSKKSNVDFAELRNKARQFSLPRLVTDGHNYRYFVDLSDLPSLQRFRTTQKEARAYYEKLKQMKLDSAQTRDSIEQFWARQYPPQHRLLLDAILEESDTNRKNTLRQQYMEKFRQERFQRESEVNQFEQEKSDISKLIGIRIPSKQARAEGDEYLLWYDPTPEFIALLPERYRTGLEREVAAAKKYATKCEIPTEEERKAIPGYFDSWRSCDGVLKIASIFPNPADVKATVRFTLAEARSVTITVHNLNGDRLAILEPTPVLPAGEHELPLDFTGRNVGVYLLALSTDKNETAIKRVIISR